MGLWDTIRRTGQRQAGVDPLDELEVEGANPLLPDQDYFRIVLAQMHLANKSTFLSHWLPGAHVRVKYTRQDAPAVEYAKVLRPDAERMAAGARINFPVTDLVPYRGGVVEIEAALFGLQNGTRLDLAVDVLEAVSGLALPAVATAVTVASQVTAAAKKLVEAGDGVVHLNIHQSYVSADGTNAENTLRPLYLAARLAGEPAVDPTSLRVVKDRLHVAGPGGETIPLVGVDFLLLKVESRVHRDDFWLPEFELLLSKAIAALRNGDKPRAENYRQDAIAAALDSPVLTWVDRERVVEAAKARFAVVAGAGLGAAGGREPRTVRDLVEKYAPDVDLVLARGPSSRAQALAG